MDGRLVPHKPGILLVEDNPVDVIMTRRALEEGGFDFRLEVIEDGEQALQFLRQNCNSVDIGLFCPDLILLDLNLPRKSGKEVLAEIRQRPSTRSIPVIILTASAADKDVVDCYSRLANCYVTKPLNMENFKKAIQNIGTFWMEIATLPKKSN